MNLRQHYKRWTGRAFRMRAACQKYDVPQCNRRRDIIDGGRNHYHFLAGDDLPGRAAGVEYDDGDVSGSRVSKLHVPHRRRFTGPSGAATYGRAAVEMGVPVETGWL